MVITIDLFPIFFINPAAESGRPARINGTPINHLKIGDMARLITSPALCGGEPDIKNKINPAAIIKNQLLQV
jgi:hypothetical protein